MKASTVETWVWVLIYGGLLMAAFGLFALRGGGPVLGWALIAGGGLLTAVGVLLVWLRSRMHDDD